MKAFVFPGQGAQFVGMGKDLYENSPLAKELFEKANEILGYRITDIMFEGTDEDLRQTKVTQPAVFLHSVISALCMGDAFQPEMTAGHSLGEFSALVAAGALSFEDGLKLVYARAMAMQKACEAQPSTMAAIIALADEKVEEICRMPRSWSRDRHQDGGGGGWETATGHGTGQPSVEPGHTVRNPPGYLPFAETFNSTSILLPQLRHY